MKTCSKCLRTLPLDMFWKRGNKEGPAGRQGRCKECGRAENRAWQQANKEQVKVHDRKKMLKARYGIDAAERYDALYEMQEGRCAICNKRERLTTEDGRITRLAMDHCHETGKVRGLLCRSCNGLLGQIGDTAEQVRRFLNYVEAPPGYVLPGDMSKPPRWATKWDACRECGTTEVSHSGNGYCHNCYMRRFNKAKSAMR